MSDAEQIEKLRAALRSVTDHLESILNEGMPSKGRSADDQDAAVGWWDDKRGAIKAAREALDQALPVTPDKGAV